MLPSYILALREGLEAALVIGIILGGLSKANRPDLKTSVWRGVASALLASTILAISLDILGMEFEGPVEMIFEGSSMFLAAALLSWMIFWVGRNNKSIKPRLEGGISQALSTGGAPALFMLVFLAVVREGIELAIFLFAARLASDGVQTISGALFGLASAALVGWFVVSSSRRINLKRFFQISNVLLMFFAAGLVAHGAREFIQLGWLPVGINQVWNLNAILSDQSIAGQLLAALFGYTSTPSLTEVLSYMGYFLLLGLALRFTVKTPQIKADAA